MSQITLESPAKINLFLSVTGRRLDGFHDLVSVVAPLQWGDRLTVEPAKEFSLTCTDPALPTDGSNLVLKAADAFRKLTNTTGGAKFRLEKRIPIGAGLGGGSSNAAMALRALNQLAGTPLSPEQLHQLASEIGSDCPLFLYRGPVIMRGRGERVESVGESAARRITGRSVIVFKPGFGISTPWAYSRMAADPSANYTPSDQAERRWTAWEASDEPLEGLVSNNMERPAFSKFPALPALLERLRGEFGLGARMSGSGSACFALLPDGIETEAVKAMIFDSWGESAFLLQTRLG